MEVSVIFVMFLFLASWLGSLVSFALVSFCSVGAYMCLSIRF